MTPPQGERLLDIAAWRAFCARLADAGELVLDPRVPATATERAEGFRFLSRLVRLSMIWNIEAQDTDHPLFFQVSDAVTKPLGGDVPDIIYWACLVDGGKDYRVTARGVNVFHFGIGSKRYHMHLDGTAKSTGELEGGEMRWAADGGCEIILSARRPANAPNWLPMEADTNMILIRQTRGDWVNERGGEFTITRIDARTVPPAPLTAEVMEQAFQRTTDFVTNHAQAWLDFFFAQGFERRRNEIIVTDQGAMRAAGANPLVEIQYGHFDLAEDEVWIIDFTPPPCLMWSLSLYNWWMESLDFRTRRTAVNKISAKLETDGRLVLAIAAKDPGFGNWLDTAGHKSGFCYFRWTGAEALPCPRSKVIRV